ncbi:MAG: biotin--[acetyl-CoA-carboxylase] ligase [Bacteroidales bacterium]|nr:biotin--[acetyl-CoA-carboxylase] ligase [Bacteroidales bacterium]MBO7463297.1 biotin--[acetyl-CoA-carboxylase] ligase [Bacteroidales bacterium]
MTNEIKYSIIDSTNNEAQRQLQNGVAPKGDFVIRADFQTDGRGQRGNTWYSPNAMNLMFSYVFFPTKLEVRNQFMLSQASAIAVAEYLKQKGVEDVSIKWPNDVYVGMKKICGMLIENTVSGHYIRYSIIGIGLNINQTTFPDNLPNPISLTKCTGKQYDLDQEFSTIIEILRQKIYDISASNAETLMSQYKSIMLGLDRTLIYRSGGKVFKGIIRDVDRHGMLTVEDAETNVQQSYAFNEVNLVIPEQKKENI